MKNLIIAIILFFGSIKTEAQLRFINYRSIPAAITTENKAYEFTRLNDVAHVYIFYAPECPLSQKYTLTIANLYNKYSSKIKFVGVFPGTEESPGQYENFKTKYNIKYPLLKDQKLALVAALKATVTPEVFLIDPSGKIIYNGAIDDWAIKLGKTKQQATVNYLENAIGALLNSTNVEPRYIKPIGCYIEQ